MYLFMCKNATNDKKVPFKKVADAVGRSARVVSNAVNFYKLPKEVREISLPGIEIPYGVLTAVARLYTTSIEAKHPMDNDSLKNLVLRYFVGAMNMRQFNKMITTRIKSIKDKKPDLFSDGVFISEDENDLLNIISGEQLKALYGFFSYIARLSQLFKSGELAKNTSRYNADDIIRAIEQIYAKSNMVLQTIELLEKNTGRDYSNARNVVCAFKSTVESVFDL